MCDRYLRGNGNRKLPQRLSELSLVYLSFKLYGGGQIDDKQTPLFWFHGIPVFELSLSLLVVCSTVVAKAECSPFKDHISHTYVSCVFCQSVYNNCIVLPNFFFFFLSSRVGNALTVPLVLRMLSIHEW